MVYKNQEYTFTEEEHTLCQRKDALNRIPESNEEDNYY